MCDFSVFNDFFYTQFGEESMRFETIVDDILKIQDELDGKDKDILDSNFVQLYLHLLMRRDNASGQPVRKTAEGRSVVGKSFSRFVYLKPKYVKKKESSNVSYYEAYILAKYLLLPEAAKKKLGEVFCDSWMMEPQNIFYIFTDDFLEQFFCSQPKLDCQKAIDYVLEMDKRNERLPIFEDESYDDLAELKIVKELISKYFGILFVKKVVYDVSKNVEYSEKTFCADFLKRYNFVKGFFRDIRNQQVSLNAQGALDCPYISSNAQGALDVFTLDLALLYKLDNYNNFIQKIQLRLDEFNSISPQTGGEQEKKSEIQIQKFSELPNLNQIVYERFVERPVQYQIYLNEFYKYYFRIICCAERSELWTEFVDILKKINAGSKKIHCPSELLETLKKDGEKINYLLEK